MVLPEKEESDIAWHSLSSNDTAVFGLSGQIVSNDVSDPFFPSLRLLAFARSIHTLYLHAACFALIVALEFIHLGEKMGHKRPC